MLIDDDDLPPVSLYQYRVVPVSGASYAHTPNDNPPWAAAHCWMYWENAAWFCLYLQLGGGYEDFQSVRGSFSSWLQLWAEARVGPEEAERLITIIRQDFLNADRR